MAVDAQPVPTMDHGMDLASWRDASASALTTNYRFKPGVFFLRHTGGHVPRQHMRPHRPGASSLAWSLGVDHGDLGAPDLTVAMCLCAKP